MIATTNKITDHKFDDGCMSHCPYYHGDNVCQYYNEDCDMCGKSMEEHEEIREHTSRCCEAKIINGRCLNCKEVCY